MHAGPRGGDFKISIHLQANVPKANIQDQGGPSREFMFRSHSYSVYCIVTSRCSILVSPRFLFK